MIERDITTDQIVKAQRYLAQTSDALVETTEGLFAPQWEYKPAIDRWSIAEIVEHVAVIEQRVHIIIGKMNEAPESARDANRTHMDDFIIARVPERSTRVQAPPHVLPTGRWSGAQALEYFLKSRKETGFLLLSAPLLRGRVVPHPIFGPWDGYQWVLAAAAHSARHTQQILEVQSDPNFPREIAAEFVPPSP